MALAEGKAAAVEKVGETGLLQRVILLAVDAATPPQKGNNDVWLTPDVGYLSFDFAPEHRRADIKVVARLKIEPVPKVG